MVLWNKCSDPDTQQGPKPNEKVLLFIVISGLYGSTLSTYLKETCRKKNKQNKINWQRSPRMNLGSIGSSPKDLPGRW